MIVKLYSQRLQSLNEIRDFLAGSNLLDFEVPSRDEAYQWIEQSLRQLGYFRKSGKFFAPNTFCQRDIKYLKERLQITEILDFTDYPPARVKQQRARILELLGWTAFDANSVAQIARHVQLQAEQQIKPERVFAAAIDFCWQQRIEIPIHHQLANVITDSFNIVESAWLVQVFR